MLAGDWSLLAPSVEGYVELVLLWCQNMQFSAPQYLVWLGSIMLNDYAVTEAFPRSQAYLFWYLGLKCWLLTFFVFGIWFMPP